MNASRSRSAMKSAVAVFCAACFLTMTLGAASRAVAAEDWPVWPKKTAEPGVEVTQPPPPPQVQPQPAAAKEGSEAGQAVKKGTSAGTIGWIAAGVAAAIGIGVAVGGGGSSSNH